MRPAFSASNQLRAGREEIQVIFTPLAVNDFSKPPSAFDYIDPCRSSGSRDGLAESSCSRRRRWYQGTSWPSPEQRLPRANTPLTHRMRADGRPTLFGATARYRRGEPKPRLRLHTLREAWRRVHSNRWHLPFWVVHRPALICVIAMDPRASLERLLSDTSVTYPRLEYLTVSVGNSRRKVTSYRFRGLAFRKCPPSQCYVRLIPITEWVDAAF